MPETPIKLPKSSARIQEMLSRAETRVHVLEELKEEAESELWDLQLAIVYRALPDASSKDLSIGTWDCSPSPIGVCVYDPVEDPCCDNCLFCQQPQERK